MFIVLWLDFLKILGIKSIEDKLLTVFTFGLYFFYLNYFKIDELKFNNKTKRTSNWFSSIIFAVVAASIIRMFIIQAYVIPTPSMENTMLVGDLLFVEKLSYGVRMPMTSLSLPLFHDKIPVIKIPSYLDVLQLPFFRIPGWKKVNRSDLVVFNYPMELDKPIDKKVHYIKRCVAIPGDTIEIVSGQIYINNKPLEFPKSAKRKFYYSIQTNGSQINKKVIQKKYGITLDIRGNAPTYFVFLDDREVDVIKGLYGVVAVDKIDFKKTMEASFDDIFPKGKKWNVDYYGPLYVPKKNDVVRLSIDNINNFERVISVYEKNDLSIRGDTIFINDRVANEYEFKKDYYFMMGDNSHNSEDSRFWGFVPDDHIVGNPWLIWFSWNNQASGIDKIRTDRLFTFIQSNDEKPKSYLIHFLLITLGIYLSSYFYKRYKKRNNIIKK